MGNQVNTLNGACCDPTGRYESCGCVDGVGYVQLTVIGASGHNVVWLNTETGDIFTTKPPGFVTGTCQEAAAADVLKFSATAPTATAPFANPKDGYTTIQTSDGTEDGDVVALHLYDEQTATWKEIKLSPEFLITPVTTAPAATGNTPGPRMESNAATGEVWFIDTDGVAVQIERPATVLWDDDQVLTGDTTTNTTVTLTPVVVTDPDNPAVSQTNYTVKAEAKIDGTTIVEDPTTKVLSAANQKPDVLLTAQPTPTATGNTTNLNSVFKDATGATWFVDKDGEAILMGAAVFKEANRFYVDPNGLDTNTGANEAPFLTAQAAVDALTANDTAVLNEGTYAAVTMSVQNTALAGASSTYGSLSQIAAVTVATASGTSNKISDLTVTGNLARTGNAPLYVNNVTVSGNVTLAGTAYTEIRDSSIQDGSITVSGASVLLIEDSKIGTSTFNTAGSAIALRNVTIDAGDTVTFGPGVVYSLSGTTGNVVRDPAAINVEDALVSTGLTAAQAEAVVTTHFHHIRMHNADVETSPTQVVTRDPVTGELEVSNLSALTLNVLTTVQPTPTATGNTTNLNSTFKDAAGDTWIVDSNGDAVKAGSATAAAPVHATEVQTSTAGQTSFTLTDTPIGAVIVTRNGVDISDSFTWVGNVGTYNPANNLGCTFDAGDKLRFHFETAA